MEALHSVVQVGGCGGVLFCFLSAFTVQKAVGYLA